MEKTNTPILAGTLSIISAAFGFLGGLIFVVMYWLFKSFLYLPEEPEVETVFFIMRTVYIGIGVFLIIVAILAIVGGIFSLLRKRIQSGSERILGITADPDIPFSLNLSINSFSRTFLF